MLKAVMLKPVMLKPIMLKTMLKPFSQACVNNSDAILAQLQRLLTLSDSVLEIGSGSGQHGVCFAEGLPHLDWQTSDVPDNHFGINLWIDEYSGKNCWRPLTFDVMQPFRANKKYSAVFTANTLHILSWPQVEALFQQLPQVLEANAVFIAYGPFNYAGQYTSESNARFDQWLKSSDSRRGIRGIEQVNKLAANYGLSWEDDIAMPANNRLQVWRYQG